MSNVHVKTERSFNPQLLLLRAAQHHLRSAKEKGDGCCYDWLGAIVLSALAIEAIGNSYGKVLIPDWKENVAELQKKGKASPIQKLKLVAARCRISPDFGSHPWLTVKELARFRNDIAHATREHLKVEDDCTVNDYWRIFHVKLESNVEKMITEDFASRSCDAIEQILSALNQALKGSELYELVCDGHTSLANMMDGKGAWPNRSCGSPPNARKDIVNNSQIKSL